MTRLAVVILNWNGCDDTLACLESIQQAEVRLELDLIVVDNGSVDDSVPRIMAFDCAVTLLETGANLGYAGGNNKGIELALSRGADAICVLNNDTTVTPGMFEALLDAVQGETLCAASPLIRYSGSDEIWYAGAEPTDTCGLPAHDTRSASQDGLHPTAYLTGCCIVATAAVWREVGGFDESFFLIFEDSDWSRRAAALGVALVVVDHALLRHHVSSSFGRTGGIGLYYWTRNALAFLGSGRGRVGLTAVAKLGLIPALRDLRRDRLAAVRPAALRGLAVLHALLGITGAAGPVPTRLGGGRPAGTRPILFGVLIDDPAHRWPGRNMLLLELSKRAPLILMETPRSTINPFEIRAPRLERLQGNVFVIRNAAGFGANRLFRRIEPLARRLDRWLIARALRPAGWTSYLLWLTVADVGLLARLRRRQSPLVFDVMDPNFLPEHQRSHDRAVERIGREADLVFCTAQSLLRRMQSVTERAHLLPNAADPVVVTASADDVLEMRGRLGLRDGAVAGYLGTIDWRFDAETVGHVAEALPEVDFVIAGRVNADQEPNVRHLRELSNVFLPGSLSYADGYACTGLLDVALIPFRSGPMNDAVNSVKMYMYLCAGKPVVSTWLEESVANPYVEATRSPEEFAAAVARLLLEDDQSIRQIRSEFGLSNTWEIRAQQAWEMLAAAGLLDSRS